MNIPHLVLVTKTVAYFPKKLYTSLKVTKIRAFQQLFKNLTYNYTTLFIRLSRKNANIMEFSYLRNTFLHV